MARLVPRNSLPTGERVTATIDITASALMTALRTFLMGVYAGQVIQSQDNRVPMPVGNFCTITPLLIKALSMSHSTYTDPGTNPGTESNQRSTQWNVQLDFYGPTAADACAIIAALIRTDYACEQLATSGMQPLYAGDPKQTTMMNAEQQYEPRWTVEFVAQYNPVVNTPLDFASRLDATLVSVDVKFPP